MNTRRLLPKKSVLSFYLLSPLCLKIACMQLMPDLSIPSPSSNRDLQVQHWRAPRSGSIPDATVCLTTVTYLLVGLNALVGRIPNAVSSWTEMTNLDLQGHGLSVMDRLHVGH